MPGLTASTDATAAARAACGADLLRVLLNNDTSATLPPARDAQLRACVRRLPAPQPPPAAMLSLAAAVQRKKREPHAALRRYLRSTVTRMPLDVEGTRAHKCNLCRSPLGRRFAHHALSRHVAAVFAAAAAGSAAVGAPLTLSRYDLFHGHMFSSHGALGLLLHAREYPALEPGVFDVHLGFCQHGSPLAWDARAMALRNVLYVMHPGAPAVLALLDTAPGTLLHDELLAPGVRELHTVYEEDLGVPLADVYYFHALPRLLPEHRVFVCT